MCMTLSWMGVLVTFLFGFVMGSGWWLANRLWSKLF